MQVDGVEFQEAPANALPLQIGHLAPGVKCLFGWFQDWGANQWRNAAHLYHQQVSYHKRQPTYNPMPGPPLAYTREWALGRLDSALASIQKGLVLAAFPTYSPYNKNAGLLRERGFRLLGNRCYPNANYAIPKYSTLPKGSIYSPDGYPHWIHVWAKDLGGLENSGLGTPELVLPGSAKNAEIVGFPNCCGLKVRWSTKPCSKDAYNPLLNIDSYLAICQIPASQKFDRGFKRFALYKDFKWGINLDSPDVKGVQKCPHEFDLAAIEKWELAQPLAPIQ